MKVINGTDLDDGEVIDDAELYYQILLSKSDKPIKRNRRKKYQMEIDDAEGDGQEGEAPNSNIFMVQKDQ